MTTNYDKAVRNYNARFDNAMIPSGPDSSGNERHFAGKDYVLDNCHGLLAAFEIGPRLRYVEDLPKGVKAEWGYDESETEGA